MLEKRQNRKLFLFIMPALIIYLTFYIIPMFNGLYYSMTDWNGMSPTKKFVGLSNYAKIFTDAETLKAVSNTLIYTIVVTSLSIVIGFVLALALEKASRMNYVYRTIIFAPAVLSPVVASFIWKYMYSPNSGIINTILQGIGLDFLKKDWLGNPKLALYSVMLVPLWQWGGNVMIVFLAGLMNISPDYYDAAAIDGVNGWQKVRYIIIPLIKPAIVFNVIISTIGSLKTFDFIFIMTNGGPGFSSEVLTLRIYKYMLYTPKFGYGSAVAVMLTAIVVIFSLVEYRLLSKD